MLPIVILPSLLLMFLAQMIILSEGTFALLYVKIYNTKDQFGLFGVLCNYSLVLWGPKTTFYGIVYSGTIKYYRLKSELPYLPGWLAVRWELSTLFKTMQRETCWDNAVIEPYWLCAVGYRSFTLRLMMIMMSHSSWSIEYLNWIYIDAKGFSKSFYQICLILPQGWRHKEVL